MDGALRNSKGITLVELLVGMMLLSVIAAAASVVLVSIVPIFTDANDFAEYSTMLDDVANHIISDFSEMSTATSLSSAENHLSFNTFNSGTVVYTTIDPTIDPDDPGGRLWKTGVLVFPDIYYKGKGIGFEMEEADPAEAGYVLTVRVFNKYGEEALSREYAVKPFCMK
ncbi:MAG: prepilin-type N-terminal cleavage/methylation domain-containing protein [Oscillospiraceae bacterium]|nr:prepilin-type N-terminal cleavage/methylation domain-containing protein [Oscillospiraceae bacterium]